MPELLFDLTSFLLTMKPAHMTMANLCQIARALSLIGPQSLSIITKEMRSRASTKIEGHAFVVIPSGTTNEILELMKSQLRTYQGGSFMYWRLIDREISKRIDQMTTNELR